MIQFHILEPQTTRSPHHAVAVFLVASVLLVCARSTSAQPATAQNYVVGAQDVVALTSLEDQALTGKFTVQADGTFTLPYIGSVKAAGQTIRGLEEHIRTELKDGRFFKNPQVTVAIEQYRSQHVILMGEVRSPGSYPLTGGMRLLDLIAQAGTLTSTASGAVLVVPAKSKAKLVEGKDSDAAMPADDEIIRADLSQLQNGTLDRPVELHDGDTVIVLQAERAYILGEVRNPNAYPIPAGTTLQQLLALAGGTTADAALNRVTIARFEKGLRVEIKAKPTDIVKPGDTVIVPTRFF